METVKVDLQKLQLLNDRIAQTIEALNQLRLSTHGLQQAATFDPNVPAGSGFPVFQPPMYTTPILSHTSPTGTTFARNGLGAYGWVDPAMQQRIQQAFPFLTSVYSPIV